MARRLLAQDKPDSTEADVGRSEPEPGKSPDRHLYNTVSRRLVDTDRPPAALNGFAHR